jgi:hypothetical protein
MRRETSAIANSINHQEFLTWGIFKMDFDTWNTGQVYAIFSQLETIDEVHRLKFDTLVMDLLLPISIYLGGHRDIPSSIRRPLLLLLLLLLFPSLLPTWMNE